MHKFDEITTAGLHLILIFATQVGSIISSPLHTPLIAVPLILQTFLIFFIAYFGAKIIKLPFEIAALATLIGASNFFELALAVAILLFGANSPAVLWSFSRSACNAMFGRNLKRKKAKFQRNLMKKIPIYLHTQFVQKPNCLEFGETFLQRI
ncbi:MAG: hypothetical protein MR902_05515 [Campylobacter sp.]|nr:hypothetical protein [Campylobacter sp.]